MSAAAYTPPEWAAASAPDARGAEAVLQHGDRELERVPVGQRAVTLLGRNSAMADVLVEHESVSRRHAALLWRGDELVVMDVGSSHGTLVNDRMLAKHEPAVLHDGDVVRLAGAPQQLRIALTSKRPAAEEATSTVKRAAVAVPTKVRALHILVKHRGSRRPSSWRETTITRTKEAAIERLKELQDRILSGKATFEEVARTESDCSSARDGGDLGTFGKGQMQPAFERAAFALQVGEMSGIVDTDSGVHIIKRLE